MAVKYQKLNKRKSYKRKTYKRRSASKRRAPIKAMIRKEIARNIENKTKQVYNLGVALATSSTGAWETTNVFPLGFQADGLTIEQGIGQAQRIGNRIKIKKLMFKGTLCPQPYNVTVNPVIKPQQVKMLIMYDKTDPVAAPNPQDDLFQNGGSVMGLQNDLVDMWAPFNTDKYRILAQKTFKLGYADSQQYTTGGANGPLNQVNNDFKLNHNFSFNLAKLMPAIVKYNDNNTNATSRGIYCCIFMCSADGSQYGAGYYPSQVQYMLDCQYEDA